MGSSVGHRGIVALGIVFLCSACATKTPVTNDADSAVAEPTREEQPEAALGAGEADIALMEGAEQSAATDEADKGAVVDPCEQEDTEGWLDGTQEWVYQTTCRTAAWFDSFFGANRYDERTGETYGRVGLSGFWDERDGFDPSLRFRAKFALPSARNRASLMIGRGEEEELIEERTTKFDTIPGNFNRIEDDSFLVGLGFTGKKRTGFKLSVGAKVRAPPEPYVKLRYRKHFALTDSTMLGVRPILYWKNGRTLRLDAPREHRPAAVRKNDAQVGELRQRR